MYIEWHEIAPIFSISDNGFARAEIEDEVGKEFSKRVVSFTGHQSRHPNKIHVPLA